MSAVAAEACRIVSRIRAKEMREVWSQNLDEDDDVDDHQADEILYPGVMFNIAKGRMERTKLWKIVEKMPKGMGVQYGLVWFFFFNSACYYLA